MTFVSYAQNFEDVLLWRALHDVPRGRYIDIGAQDPQFDSVSLAFYNAGWRGIHVEPVPENARRLREARPDEMVMEAAVADLLGPIKFFEVIDTGLSTGRGDIAQEHGKAGYEQRELVVPCVRLSQIFDLAGGEVHWLKIDVEGMEADVLRSWDESAARPWILVVESTYPNSQRPTQDEWLEEIVSRGYREAHFDGLSRYFVHDSQPERQAAFAAPTNIFDNFVVTRQHFTARNLREDVEQVERVLLEERAASSELSRRLAEAETLLESADVRASSLQEQLSVSEASAAAAGTNEKAALQSLAAAERAHRDAMEKHWLDRHSAQEKMRRDFSDLNAQMHEALRTAQASLASTGAQLAESQQRSEWLRSESEAVQSELRRERDHYRAAALRADQLIRSAVADRAGRLRQIAAALGLRKPAREIQALAGWTFSHPARTGESEEIASRPIEQISVSETKADMRNPYLRADSLADLLAFEDLEFVRCSYVTILGRQPDLAGEAHYTRRIRKGHSKLEVLWQLRRSPEGATHDPGIAGLDRALKRASWERRAFIGGLVRLVTRGEPDDRLARMERAILNSLALMRARPESERPAPNLQPSFNDATGAARAREMISGVGLPRPAQRALDILVRGHGR